MPEIAQYLNSANSALLVPLGLVLVAGERSVVGGRDVMRFLELRVLMHSMMSVQHGFALPQGVNPLTYYYAMRSAPIAMQGATLSPPYASYAAAQPPPGYAQPPYARPAGVVAAPPGISSQLAWPAKEPPPPPAVL
jgi:hypothetical protein